MERWLPANPGSCHLIDKPTISLPYIIYLGPSPYTVIHPLAYYPPHTPDTHDLFRMRAFDASECVLNRMETFYLLSPPHPLTRNLSIDSSMI